MPPNLKDQQHREQPTRPHIADNGCQGACLSLSSMGFKEKFVSTPGVIEIAGRHVKRYHVYTEGEPIEPTVEDAAYAFLPALLPDPDDETPPAAFTILHRNRQGAFLDAYSWVWTNVIECRVAAAGIAFLGCDDEDPTHFKPLSRPWIGCVWELAPFGHERSAWVRHILEPDRPDLAAYLADSFAEGMAGGPR
jgi:hypothetical protein